MSTNARYSRTRSCPAEPLPDKGLSREAKATRDRLEKLDHRLSRWKLGEGWIIWNQMNTRVVEEFSLLSSVNAWCDIVEKVQ